MGAARKLQNEIESVLKKVKEGVAAFDDTHEKLMQQDVMSQREKLVASLKDQIKKLQKDRDKIKTWASDKEVRDKKHLADARAMIERRMEKFKECEKELKVKDFSKVGLEKGTKLDPKQAATDERREWIRNCVERIDGTVEINEAEIDSIMGNVKRGKEPPSRVGRIQARNAAHKKHTERLEQVLRALDNEAISIEQVDTLKEGIEDYLENGNASGDDTFYGDVDLFYEEEVLNILDNVDVHVPIVTDRVAPRVPDHTEKAEKRARDKERENEKARKEEREKEKEREKSSVAAARAQIAAKGNSTYTTEDKSSVQARAPVIKDPPPPPPPRTALQQSAVPSSQQASQSSGPGTELTGSHGARTPAAPIGSAWAGTSSAPSGAATATSAGQPASTAGTVDSSPVQPPPVPSTGMASPTPMSMAPPGIHTRSNVAPTTPPGRASLGPAAGDASIRSDAHVASAPPIATSPMPVLEPGSLMMTLQDKRPHPFDGIWTRYPCARRSRATRPRPLSYPTVPPSILDNPRFYTNLGLDSPSSQHQERSDIDLFYIFYLTPGTQYQYLAACELRQRNWRYHKEEKAWFQRAESPSERTHTYEKGDYVYFDHTLADSENSWVLRLKKDFKIEYSQVEGDAWCTLGTNHLQINPE